jgi:hypothetical protein
MNPLTYEQWAAQQSPVMQPEFLQSGYQQYLASTGTTPFGGQDYTQTATQEPSFTYGTPNYSGGGFSGMDGTSYGGNPNETNVPNLPYGSIATGLFQLPFAIKAWKDAKKAVLPQFSQTAGAAKNLEQANQMATQGFTGSERGAYEQSIGNDMANNYRRAKEISGGQGSGAIFSMLNGMNSDARNRLAVSDAQLMRSNIANRNLLESQNQDIQDKNTELGINMYNKKQAASAALTQSTIKNLASSANIIGGFI